jgi:hypothetical protein
MFFPLFQCTSAKTMLLKKHGALVIAGFLLGVLAQNIISQGDNQFVVHSHPPEQTFCPKPVACRQCPGTGNRSTTATAPPRWNYSIVTDAVRFQSMAIRSKCSDKCTVHRYQELYARTLVKYRESQVPSRLLEIGLGCMYDKCALGGPITFREFLPHTTYHALEIDVSACKSKYAKHGVSAELSDYIDNHICHGSSADKQVVSACGTKFGPFDVVIDDGSHMLAHTSFSFRYWLKSTALTAGGFLIIEDLQVTAIEHWAKTALDYAHSNSKQPPIARGTTVVNYAQSLMLCKLAGVLCVAPSAGEEHAMLLYADVVDQIIVGTEAVAFRKAGGPSLHSTEGQRTLTSDVILALDDKAFSSLDKAASVLIIWMDGVYKRGDDVSSTTASQLRASFGAYGFRVTHLRLSTCGSVSSCVAAMGSALFNLIVVEMPTNSADASTWGSQGLLIDLLGSQEFVASGKLAVGGAVMINGYQQRGIHVQRVPSPAEPTAAHQVKEPVLRFIADFVMQHLVVVPTGSLNDRQWSAYAVERSDSVTRVISFFSDVSLDSHGAAFFRRGDPRHSRSMAPCDHL